MTRINAEPIHDPEFEEAVLSGRSYLVVDYGHSACVATLYDVVEGHYRMIGRGEGLNTSGPPWFDLSYGLQQAIAQIAAATGRKLLTLQGQLVRPMRSDGSGVDYFGATVSLGEPLRVIVAGLLENASIANARKALQAVYAREVACLSLDDRRGRPGQVEAILEHQPDVLFFVGGTDGGADKQMRDLLNTIAMALELQAELVRPTVIYGGNASLRPLVMKELSELTEVHFVDNVQPAYGEEQIDHAIAMLAQLYYSLKVADEASSGILTDWSNEAPISSAHAFGGVAEYLAAARKAPVLGIDVGAGQVTLLSAVDGQVNLLIRSDKGLGRPLRQQLLAGKNGAAEEATEGPGGQGPLADYIIDKSVHPDLIPLSKRAAKFELALASRLIRQVVTEAAAAWSWPDDGYTPPFHTLLLRGRVFANAGNQREALMALLDGLQAQGVFRIVADGWGILPAMGLLAAEDPNMVVQMLNGPDLTPMAWVVSPTGRYKTGQHMLDVSVTTASGSTAAAKVPAGGLTILPLALDERHEIALSPVTGIDVGAGPGQSRQLRISSAIMGLVIDGRKRPADT
ncbi:MAG: glutamate mutase L [Chloroflexota bacterium]|jgi:hypothetical protein